jgi:flagellar hook-associated protein 1 FlgK
MISDLGVASSQASNDVTNQNALVTSLNNSRQSVSGVSLDEEMTNMVQEQSAYEAAAKLVNVIADMMQTVINMGGTGS